MKSILKTFALLTVIISLAGCQNVTTNVPSAESGVTAIPKITEINTTDIVANVQNTEKNKPPTSIENSATNEKSDTTDYDYDIDLTQMSPSMVYAQVYDMVCNGDNYLGQTVKVKGPFSYFQETDGREFFAVIISDATACCSQGIEFVLNGDYSYPDDYPAIGTEITVIGKFNYYTEEFATYCQLLNASMEIDAS
ncbi:hypothetical protein [Ruminococcus sp.]|uniref:hypothetical protein n=1 Tax=Ruminococcus sp. TaxID=41978 RepID=UPI0025D3DFE7|nr:hypothetical protein [Ruminococcus sp.]